MNITSSSNIPLSNEQRIFSIEIQYLILDRIPLTYRHNMRRVCREWNKYIMNNAVDLKDNEWDKYIMNTTISYGHSTWVKGWRNIIRNKDFVAMIKNKDMLIERNYESPIRTIIYNCYPDAPIIDDFRIALFLANINESMSDVLCIFKASPDEILMHLKLTIHIIDNFDNNVTIRFQQNKERHQQLYPMTDVIMDILRFIDMLLQVVHKRQLQL